MSNIGFGYGSEWHLLRYVGYHRAKLNNDVLSVIPGKAIEWLDFPFSDINVRLGDDREWVGIEFISDPVVQQQWTTYWPQRGAVQNWDAVGKVYFDDREEWLLVEAKAHIDEIFSTCKAKDETSLATIKNALRTTQVILNATQVPIEAWLSPYYQYCNRLAVLNFLMKECQPAIPARLVFISFYGDMAQGKECPESPVRWKEVFGQLHAELGLDLAAELMDRVHHVFLPVNPNAKGPRRIAGN